MSADFSPISPAGFETELDKLATTSYVDTVASEVPFRTYADGERYLGEAGVSYGIGTPGAGDMRLVPFAVGPAEQTFNRIEIDVNAAAAGAVARLGIYDDAGGKPGALLIDGGTVDCSGDAGNRNAEIAATLSGMVWLAVLIESGGATLRVFSHQSFYVPKSVASDTFDNGWRATGVPSGGLPNPAPSVDANGAGITAVLVANPLA